MFWHLITLSCFLAFILSGCKFKKDSIKTTGESIAIESTAEVLPTQVEAANTLPKTEEPAPMTTKPVPVETPCAGIALVIATDQLGTGLLKAQIDFNGTSLELAFMPSTKFSTLCIASFKETSGDILNLKILQNDALRFIAKRANTAYIPGQTPRIVIDNCLIHPVPWDGRSNDGSCEWTIKE